LKRNRRFNITPRAEWNSVYGGPQVVSSTPTRWKEMEALHCKVLHQPAECSLSWHVGQRTHRKIRSKGKNAKNVKMEGIEDH
jgi:hypothetical protein